VTPILCQHFPRKKKEEQERQQAKNGYWQNELLSLGIEPKEKKVYNNTKEEL